MKPVLSILILSIHSRKAMLDSLLLELNRQSEKYPGKCEILVEVDGGQLSKGTKRNRLLEKAKGDYLAFFDDDDLPSKNYISLILSAVQTNPDCCSLLGEITIDGGVSEVFEHSLKYKVWKTNTSGPVKYERCPNHLNAIRSSLAKQIKFKEINHGEDHQWSNDLQASGLLKTEGTIHEVLYYYNYISKK